MKNRSFFILMAAVLPLISCGVAGHSAFYGGQFRNSIYYTPDNSAGSNYAQLQQDNMNAEEEADAVQQQKQSSPQNTDSKAIYIGEANEVNIDYIPGETYTIIDDGESYAARLRKFDSPTYTVNINFVEPDYWWDFHFGWHYPGWYRYHSWYGPSWSWHYPSWSWYHPSWSWYAYDWYWHNPWHDPWWGPIHRPGFHPPHHWPGYGPGHHAPAPGRPGRDVYYGKRNGSSSTYRDINRGSVSQGVNNSISGRPVQGSVTRRPSGNMQQGNVPQGNGNNKASVLGNGQQQQNKQQYRRVTRTKNQGQTNVKSANENNSSNNRSNSSYNRNSSSYNRSSSSYSNSNSSGSSYGNSGASRSSGGGSSYRRR